jgi:hypothetical protein
MISSVELRRIDLNDFLKAESLLRLQSTEKDATTPILTLSRLARIQPLQRLKTQA